MPSVVDYFTDRDESILGASQADPMGLGVIWTGFASKLFRSRVNSIVNDFRAYTVNLFHHYMVYRIRARRDANWWKAPSRRKFQEGEAATFSRMLLVNLEKILLLSFCKAGYDQYKEDGLIGLANTRNAWERQGAQGFKFVLDERDGEVLRRQVQLGFSGRYRTPFTTHLELLNPQTGHPVEFAEAWTEIDALFQGHTGFRKLTNALESTICGFLSKQADEFTVRSLDESVEALIVGCFGNRRELEDDFGPFWRERLALDEGETAWLWKALPLVQTDEGVDAKELYHKALELAITAGEDDSAGTIRMIVDLEPFLARLFLIFNGFLQVQNHSLEKTVEWVRERYGEYPLKGVAPKDPEDLVVTLEGEGRSRLRQILEFVPLDASDLVLQMLSYHHGVSEYRKSAPWVQLVGKEWRRNLTIRGDDSQQPDDSWVNGYYAGSFVSVAQAIRRGTKS